LLPPPRSRADARLLSPSAPARTLRPLLPAGTRRRYPLRSTSAQCTRIPLPHTTDKRSINGGPLWIRIHYSQVIFSCIFRTTPENVCTTLEVPSEEVLSLRSVALSIND